MAKITIVDPVTRIEGHLKVKLTIDAVNGVNRITDAECAGTQFRGFEAILNGRDPRDSVYLTQRICGICPIAHATTSSLALEAAAVITPPVNALIMRNLVMGADFIQSHILNFYLLNVPDYVSVPASAPWAPAWNADAHAELDSVGANIVLGIEARKRAHEMGAVFSGRMPNTQSYIAGGFTTVPNSGLIEKFRESLSWLTKFIVNTYIPDVELVSRAYPEYFDIGRGHGNLLSFGGFAQDGGGTTRLLNGGVVYDSEPSLVSAIDIESITEDVKYSWYQNTPPLKPAVGITDPLYPKEAAYSWLKAPRYKNLPMEVGALARMWINGDYRGGVSVMNRLMARALETLKIAQAMDRWLNELIVGSPNYNSYTNPELAVGIGLTEAPRGALGHWLCIEDSNISHYQIISPTCWNASPMDSEGIKGPLEQALIGTPIRNPGQPLEALRVIHSFDPCLACAVQ